MLRRPSNPGPYTCGWRTTHCASACALALASMARAALRVRAARRAPLQGYVRRRVRSSRAPFAGALQQLSVQPAGRSWRRAAVRARAENELPHAARPKNNCRRRNPLLAHIIPASARRSRNRRQQLRQQWLRAEFSAAICAGGVLVQIRFHQHAALDDVRTLPERRCARVVAQGRVETARCRPAQDARLASAADSARRRCAADWRLGRRWPPGDGHVSNYCRWRLGSASAVVASLLPPAISSSGFCRRPRFASCDPGNGALLVHGAASDDRDHHLHLRSCRFTPPVLLFNETAPSRYLWRRTRASFAARLARAADRRFLAEG